MPPLSLQGYAGAGLYDSVTTRHQEERRVDYSAERLSRDAEFRREVLSRVLQVRRGEGRGCGGDEPGVTGEGGWGDGDDDLHGRCEVESRAQLEPLFLLRPLSGRRGD